MYLDSIIQLLAQTNVAEIIDSNIVDAVEGIVPPFLKQEYLDIQLWRYVASLVVLISGFMLKKVLEVFFVKRLTQMFSKTRFRYNEMVVEALSKPLNALILVVSVFVAWVIIQEDIEISDYFKNLFENAFKVGIGVTLVWAVYRLVDVFAAFLDDKAAGGDRAMRGQFVPVIQTSLRIFTLIVGILTVLATLNVNITAMLGGLGIGGIAIALAAQESVGNFIGTLSIFTDRPFKVGDWIQVGDKVDGDVEQIGFRSTKVRTWPKTLMSIPNRVLASEIIDNWSRMPKRRVKMTVGVTYSTTPEQMEELLQRIRQLLKEDEGVDQDFYLVRFTEFGASSLDIFLYYFTKSIKWDEHLAVRERDEPEHHADREGDGTEHCLPHAEHSCGKHALGFSAQVNGRVRDGWGECPIRC